MLDIEINVTLQEFKRSQLETLSFIFTESTRKDGSFYSALYDYQTKTYTARILIRNDSFKPLPDKIRKAFPRAKIDINNLHYPQDNMKSLSACQYLNNLHPICINGAN